MRVRRPTLSNSLSFFLPLLAVIFFFAHCITQFNELIFTPGVLLLFMVYCGLALVFLLLFKKIFRFPRPLALFSATLATTAFLFYGQLQDALIRLGTNIYIDKSFVLLFVLVVLLVVFILIMRKKRLQ